MQPDAAPTSPLTSETVTRPPPGTLARGVWEAPAWAFYAAAALVVVGALAYLARQLRPWRSRPRG